MRAQFVVGWVTAFAEVRADVKESAFGALVDGFGAHPRQHVKRAAQFLWRVEGTGQLDPNGWCVCNEFVLDSLPKGHDVLCQGPVLLPIAASAELLCEPRRSVIS